MQQYRLYLLDPDGRFDRTVEMECEGDAHALDLLREYAHRNPILELRSPALRLQPDPGRVERAVRSPEGVSGDMAYAGAAPPAPRPTAGPQEGGAMIPAGDITNDILRSLPAEDMQRLQPHLRRKSLAVGEVLYEPGDRVDRVYFPESGLVSLIVTMMDGHEVETASRGRDGGIGYVEACGSGLMLSRVMVQIKGDAWFLPATVFRDAYEASPLLRDQVQRRTEILLADARQASACRAVHPAAGRLGRTLLEAYHHTGLLRLPLTQDFLAGLIGVGRTTITHAAGRLQDMGCIRYSRGVLHITDVPALQAYVCECYEVLQEARATILSAPPPSRVSPAISGRGRVESDVFA